MLQKVIHQLNEKDYSLLSLQMKESKADKFLSLLVNYRKENTTDKELISILNVNVSAFHTLKSRLSEKVQYFLFKNIAETRVELIQNVAKIDQLVYNTPRETAIQILKKLEAELIKNDMPNELIVVYKALKKLHLHSPKYFEYSQLYNKHVAYHLAQDSAEDLLSSFCKTLSEYYLSRNEIQLTSLVLLKKEMENVCRLYKSHRLKIYKNILDIHFNLFLPEAVQIHEETTIESMLAESHEILKTFEDDRVYKHLIQVINFLYFEYYYKLKLHKNALIYYDKISDKTEAMLLLNHSCFASHFLISKIEYTIAGSKHPNFHLKNDTLEDEPDPENIPNFILFTYHKTSIAFYEGLYPDAIQYLNKLLREISFKSIAFSEVEVKLFLAMLYLFNKDEEQAAAILRNVTRKINEEKTSEKYKCVTPFLKLLKSLGKGQSGKKDEKTISLNNYYKAANVGQYRILESIVLNDELLSKIK